MMIIFGQICLSSALIGKANFAIYEGNLRSEFKLTPDSGLVRRLCVERAEFFRLAAEDKSLRLFCRAI